jgi:hypothetical protein
LITIRLGFVIIYLNQSSERNMIDIPGCSERTNFKSTDFAYNFSEIVAWTQGRSEASEVGGGVVGGFYLKFELQC